MADQREREVDPGLYRRLIDAVPAELALFDTEGRFLFVSAQAVRDPEMRSWLIGRTEHDYCRRRDRDPEIAVRRETYRERARAQGRPVTFEESFETPHGTRHYLRTIAPISGADGTVTHFAGFGLDISERRAIEDAVRKSEEKYRSLFEQTRDVVYISTPDGRLLDINQAGLDLLGFDDKRELVDIDLARDLYIEPWEREQLRQLLAERGFVKDLEVRLKTRRGVRMTVEVTATAIRDRDGTVNAHLGFLRDVTSSRRQEKRVRQSQQMEAVGRVARGLAHEFNNLLTAINGYSDLLLQQLAAADPQRAYAEQIRNAGRRAALLIGQLVTLSRPSEVATLTVDLNQLLRFHLDLVRQVLGEDVAVELRLDPALDKVRVDPSQLEQVVLNLALNARDAMPSGGRLRIETRNRELDQQEAEALGAQPGRWVCLLVHDTGTGISPEVRERMFEPFFTTKEVGLATGLGLSTVYGIVIHSAGRIDVDSAPERGTTFRIFLPAAQEPESREMLAPGSGGETVLVVEDEPTVRELLFDLLAAEGYRVIVAVDGADALARIEDEPRRVDLLVTDVVLPGMSGPELVERLRPRFPKLLALYVSGHDERMVASHGVADLETVLRKPFEPATLTRAIRRLLAKRR